jgi:hypothetical protein
MAFRHPRKGAPQNHPFREGSSCAARFAEQFWAGVILDDRGGLSRQTPLAGKTFSGIIFQFPFKIKTLFPWRNTF